jgi:ribosomal protein S21
MLTNDMRTKLATDLRRAGISTHSHRHALSDPPTAAEKRPDEAASES